MLSIDPVDRSSSTKTSSPRSSSAPARGGPPNPAPPVMSTRIVSVNSSPAQGQDGFGRRPGGVAAARGPSGVKRAAELLIIQEPGQRLADFGGRAGAEHRAGVDERRQVVR